MSSGSSGHNVTVPEPLSSILFLTSRIAAEQLSKSTSSRVEIQYSIATLCCQKANLLLEEVRERYLKAKMRGGMS